MDAATTLTAFDWVVLAIVGLLALMGLMRGFTQEALSLAGWIAAAVVVRLFHEDVTQRLAPHTGGEASGATIAFILLFFGTLILGAVLARAVGGFAKRSLLGPLDRLLGLGFGALKGVILASVLFLLAQFATGLFDADRTPPDWLAGSRSAPLLALASGAMVTWVDKLDDEPSAGFDQRLGLPPGHPPLDGIPGAEGFYGPGAEGSYGPGAGDGYSAADRQALDRLLEEGAKSGEQVEI